MGLLFCLKIYYLLKRKLHAQSSCWADLPSLHVGPHLHAGGGKGEVVRFWSALSVCFWVWLCSWGRVASCDSQPGEGLGVPGVAGGLCTDPSLQKSCISVWTGVCLHIPFQSS